MIKKLVCVDLLFPSQFQYFSKRFYSYITIAGLFKSCQKKSLLIIAPNQLFNSSYPEIVREKMPKIKIFVLSHQGSHLNSFPTKSC